MSMFIIIGGIVVLVIAYIGYGKWLERTWGIDKRAVSPAVRLQDDTDYSPSPWYVVFAHQFSSIAGAGPVTGTMIAAMFGWLPVLLWVLIGGIFIGAVHDFAAMYASVKEDGKSMGLLIEKYIGVTGKKLFLLFCWAFSLLVVAAFADMSASTFASPNSTGTPNIAGAAAGSISLIFMVAAIVLGLINRCFKPKGWQQMVIAFVLVIVSFVIGLKVPLFYDKNMWLIIVFAYLFVASITPMSLLMQPRDLLTTFMLLGMIGGAVAGILVERPAMHLPAFNGFVVDGKSLFPTLFITIACGAISGFHSLVSSGTSSKQIAREQDMLPVSFGAMLVECLFALIVLVVAGSLAIGGTMPTGTPFALFSAGVANFLTNFGIEEYVANAFMTMCVASLALTSLDSVARIGRMSWQEFFEARRTTGKTARPESTIVRTILANKYVATTVTLLVGGLLTLGGYQNIWALFGAGNQLLAALVLIALAVFLAASGRKGYMLWVPMSFMLATTVTALGQAIYQISIKLIKSQTFELMTDGLQLFVALLLLGLATLIVVQAKNKLFKKDKESEDYAHERR